MNLVATQTKSHQIIDALSKQILSGDLPPGERLQSVRKLADTFSTSISVVQNAMKTLEASGLIERRAGSGTFVKRNQKPQAPITSNQILLSMPTENHAYSELFSGISNELFKAGHTPITIDHSEITSMTPAAEFKEEIDSLLSSQVKAVILSGDSYWRYPYLDKHPQLKSVFLFQLDHNGPFPERAVLLNHEEATYLTTSHLASRGYKRIMLCRFEPDERSLSPETYNRHHSTLLTCGYERALREYNIASYNKVFNRTKEQINKDTLSEIMTSADRPDAIVCDLDYKALEFIIAAMQLGLKIPDDLAVTGLYNTPWSEQSPIKITTVAYDWQQLATHAVNLVLKDDIEPKVIYMNPTLIVKESSGGIM